MAERRMFTKKITDDDHFLNLSSPAQALYLHLSMNADDDGFCNQITASMFKAHASVTDLEALLKNRYIYQFDSGVIVIKHWRMANALRKDRYTPTAFKNEMAMLKVGENGAYKFPDSTDSVAERLPNGCQMVAERLPQVSIGKVSIDKNNKNNISCNKNSEIEVLDQKEMWFESFWKIYPKHQDKKKAKQKFLKLCKDEKKYQEIMQGLRNVLPVWAKKDTKYIPMPTTWLNGERWNDEVDLHMEELPF
ncbi:DNA replication protein [uncultured Solobacterium sp.]|uniref:DNA replication protein n=1 Tax=uncultured Solobacterium sp. TaxID=747375 RepID=UPI0025DD69CF|nr:DNA replication protein [uncultured Solobacterium sp.]